MLNLTYEWKVDIALLITLFTLVINALGYVLKVRSKWKETRIRAYEKVYEDASFLMEYPYHQKMKASKSLLFCNEDDELQTAVRAYLDSDFMEGSWMTASAIPNRMTGEKRLEYIELVQDEAAKHKTETFLYSVDITGPGLSPAYHLADKEVSTRLARIIKYIGGNLSLFSDAIRASWESIKFMNPNDVKDRYEESLRFCPNYFQHNPRGFDDPFYDLPDAIRREYRALILTRSEKLRQKFWWPLWRMQSQRERLSAILTNYSWQFRDRIAVLRRKFQGDYLRVKPLIIHWRDRIYNFKFLKIKKSKNL